MCGPRKSSNSLFSNELPVNFSATDFWAGVSDFFSKTTSSDPLKASFKASSGLRYTVSAIAVEDIRTMKKKRIGK
jgi:hypothetical protein